MLVWELAAYALVGIFCRLAYTNWLLVRYDFARVAAKQWFVEHGVRGLIHELILASIFGALRTAITSVGFVFYLLANFSAWVTALLIRLESRI